MNTRTDVPATDRQKVFLNKLLDERPALRDVENWWPDNVERMSKREASQCIAYAMKQPREIQPAPKTGTPDLRTGSGVDVASFGKARYAAEDDEGFLHFLAVDMPKNGRWEGFAFVRRESGDGSEKVGYQKPGGTFTPARAISDEWAEKITAALRRAMTDPIAAAGRYGREIGKCGCCGKRLTDALSRSLGIGPECRKNRRVA